MSEPLQPSHGDYLRDESRRTGHAEQIVFPRSEEDVLAALAEARANRWPVTVQGARTGVAGGAVPEGGLILNLSRLTAIEAVGDTLRVEPGATLNAIRAATPPGYFFAPDPTETTASIGGMIACNSSGALSFLHGPTRNHVLGLRVALASGEVLDLRRGRDQARGRAATLGAWQGELPALPQPAVKNAAGYFTAPDMDLCDLFIGAEGTLGIVTAATLRLLPAPAAIVGLMMFLPSTAAVVDLVNALRAGRTASPAPLAALEYFDSHCLRFLQDRAAILASKGIAVPALPPGAACVYAEWHAPGAAAAEAAMLAAAEQLPDLGANPDACILADNPHELEKLKLFRHAVPELVNAEIDERRRQHPGIIKLGTDMSVPDDRLADVCALYQRDLAAAGLEHLIFGHIGANHLHVNILPRNADDYAAGRELYARWAAQIIAWGGSISAEHGIGKLKRDLFRQMAGEKAIADMRKLKQHLDPTGLLNPGTLLPAP
ncbi:MAG TPA: FAD-binding oxidoreductase [Kiritimatiellia bacterium]|nr:FAD-binding oxidoreductase [Kiritimatiellia bacterium]